MFGNNPFYRPQSSYERPVPLVLVDPTLEADTFVCFRHEWLPYILGSLQQLMQPTTWKTLSDDDLNQQLNLASLLIARFVETCNPPEPQVTDFTGDELMASLCESMRFQDGKIQVLCCGDWTDIPGQSAQGIGGPSQPGGGTPQPPIDGCVVYQAAWPASQQWLVPTLVNAGDVLTFSNAKGAANTGGIDPFWYCPNGMTFFGGQCVGVPGPKFFDPYPSLNHMSLIAIIDGTAYNAIDSTITVPGGVTNAQVVIQCNDDALEGNSGSYTLDIQVCNNAVASWAHVLDLKVSNQGLIPFNGGQWVPGIGLQSNQVDGSPNNAQQLIADLDFGADVALTHLKVIYDTATGTHGGTLFQEIGTLDAFGAYTGRAATVPPVAGSAQSLAYDSPITVRKVRLSGVLDVRPAPGITDGLWTVYTLELSGTGFDPFA